MFPVAATGLSRCTDEDTVLGGHLIPAGTEVQVSTGIGSAEQEPLMHVPSHPLKQSPDRALGDVASALRAWQSMPGDRGNPF